MKKRSMNILPNDYFVQDKMSYRFRATKWWAFPFLDDYSFWNWVGTCLLRYRVIFLESQSYVEKREADEPEHLHIKKTKYIRYDDGIQCMIANCIHFSITTSCWSTLWQTEKKKKLAQQNCTNQANSLMILFEIYNFHLCVSRWFHLPRCLLYTILYEKPAKQTKKKNLQETETLICQLFTVSLWNVWYEVGLKH